MLAIKECLIREGVLNLTSTANRGTNNGGCSDVASGGDGGGEGVTHGIDINVGAGAVAGITNAGANNTNNIYRNNYNGAAASNNLRAISANYTYKSNNNSSNDNRNNRNYDMASVLALDTPQLAKSREQKKSVDTTHCVNTNNENQSSNCSLSSISATAKSSCQLSSAYYDKSKQQLQQKQQQKQDQQQQTAGTKSTTRYHGVHPHFHHHTAPAYYTDVNLHIHTPKANDVAALNENYQSVYNTPSHLVNEHYFPKTSTATVVPPPIGTGTAIIGRANTTSPTSGVKRDREREHHQPTYQHQQHYQHRQSLPATQKLTSNSATARAAFFRGGSAVNNGERKSCELFVKSSPAFGHPTKKGDFLNDTKPSYDDISNSGDSSFVICDILNISSSDCSKRNNQLDNITDPSYTNTNNHIPITSPTSTGNKSPAAGAVTGIAASPTGTTATTSYARSRHTHRFAGKKRAVRVRSESRPISALYDIICKEKGLDIGTSTTNDEDSSSASNDIENYSGGVNANNNNNNNNNNNSSKVKNNNKKKGSSNRNSKERSRQHSNSRNNSLKTNNDYTEISNCLSAFVANSLSSAVQQQQQHKLINPYDMDNKAAATSERSKRAHKTRIPSGQKSGGSKKRKDHGKASSKAHMQTRSNTRYAASDEEHNAATETSEDSSARAKLSSRAKHRSTASDGHYYTTTNGTGKASSLPPRLHGDAHISSPYFCTQQQQQQHTASCHLNANGADSYAYTLRNKCPVHCRCHMECVHESLSSIGQRSSLIQNYQNNEYNHQSLSLPPLPSQPNQSCAGPCSTSLRSSSTADDNSLMVADSLGYSPDKLYIEPINMTLSGMSSSGASANASVSAGANGSANAKNVNSSSSGVIVEPTSSNSLPRCIHQRLSRAQQRRLREEMRRHTDLPLLDMLSPLGREAERVALSEDEGVAGVKEGKKHASKARRFINRPSRTPSRGRTGNSVNGSPHPVRRGSTHQHKNNSESSSSSSTSTSSPPASNCCCSSINDNHLRSSPNTPSTSITGGDSCPVNASNISLSGVTIEDVGSASSADHLVTHIKLSPLEVMTNSATPTTELRPPANGGVVAPAADEAHPVESELNCVVGTAAAKALQQRKFDIHTHKIPCSNAIIRSPPPPNTKISTTTTIITNAISLNKSSTTNLKQCSQQQLQQQQQKQQHRPQHHQQNQSNNHNNNISHNNNTSKKNILSNNSYAMPTETFLLKQKAATLAANGGVSLNSSIPAACIRKKSLSPLRIIPIPPTSPPAQRTTTTTTQTAHQLSHQQNAQQQQSNVSVSKLPQRRQSPLLGAPPPPLSPYALTRSPLSPCSPLYVRTTKASRLRAAALDKKKCEEDAALYQRSRSPTSPHPTAASPKYLSPRLSTSSSSENPRTGGTAGFDSDTKLPASTSSSSPSKQIGSGHQSTSSSIDSPKASKKLIPSVSISVKQNLREMQFNGDIKLPSTPRKVITVKSKKQRTPLSPATECTAKFTRSAGRLSTTADDSDTNLMLLKNGIPLPRPRTSTLKSNRTKSLNEVKSNGGDENSPNQLELSPVNGATPDSSMEERDKSSKRKSNLNRSLNDEATVDSDDSLAARRRRRRELGMVRQLVPSDDPVVREMLLPHQNKISDAIKTNSDSKPGKTELAYHMEIARRGWDLINMNANARARSETASPKYESNMSEATKAKATHARLARRSDTLHLGELRKLRSNDVNRKVNERTKSDLAEIKKIAEQANVEMAMVASGIASELAEQVVQVVDLKAEANDQDECFVELATPARYGLGCRGKAPPAPSFSELDVAAEAIERDSSPAKHATFVQEERIYYDTETSDQVAKSVSNTTMASGLLRQRMLKARSMERDAGHEPPKLSPILRRRSTDDPAYMTVPITSTIGLHSTSPSTTSHNHIVSILKKKDHIAGESSSASSNASPVTFSANVVDTPTTKQKRAGILKKRSSLDESRYYSRSHSPDERSILIKSARRNSLEETAGIQQQQQQQHGILKQSSYESSKSDGCPSATEPHPHGILKKKDSTSTPSDGGAHAPKHVSISQAVKMAVAELGHETADSQYAASAAEHDESGYTPSNEEYEIRPILKLESTSSDDAMRPPKPILKKKSSGDSDEYEIRPILKTSRKSSREEFDLGGSLSEDGRHYSELPPPTPPVRPILKTDSPSKRRSLGGGYGAEGLEQDACNNNENVSDSAILLKRRTRSLDRQEAPVVDLAEALNAIATSQAAPVEFASTPITTGGNISVAERIKNMEKFLNSTRMSPTSVTDANSSWDSPLQAGMTPRLLKPSAIKRDMYRDRYKTQPVTNDEKMLFKATASPLDTSATSAFKPAKSLDAGLNYTTFAHLNAPSAASSISPSSTYTLARCSTQPLYHQANYNAGVGVGASAISTPPLRPLNSLGDTTTTPTTSIYNNSLCEQLTLSVGSDSERIFEMSGIDDNSLLATSEIVQSQSEGGCSGGSGLTRQNSVRARANMFQQLQEKQKHVDGTAAAAASGTTATAFSREGHTSPRRALPQFSPTSAMPATPPIMSSSLTSNEEPNTTPQNLPRTDEEIEPTSLPVSERLRFFTNLTEAANRSASNSYMRSSSQRYLSMDRCGSANSYNHNNNSFSFTPRSSYNGGSSTGTSSASVTPTPMDCCSPPLPLCEPQHLMSITEIESAVQMQKKNNNAESAQSTSPSMTLSNATHETSAFIKLAKSSSQTSLPTVEAERLGMSAPAPAPTTIPAHAVTSPSVLTPVSRRIKMKTIGKLLLPHTFLNNERNQSNGISSASASSNNNTSGSSNESSIMNGHNDTCDSGESNSIEMSSKPLPLKKIGKIKSPFIENCLQMQQKHHQLNSKCMKYDHKSTPHNALAALENNVTNGAGGERDVNSLPTRKPLQNGNAALPSLPTRSTENDDNNADSGKENNYCETSGVPLLTLSPTGSSIGVAEQMHSPVVEMRKKFTRIMSNSTLSTMSQRHTAYGLSNGGTNVNSNGNGGGGGGSGSISAPTTPRNSIIDEKFAKYFGLTGSSSCHTPRCTQTTTTTTTNKIHNKNDYCEQNVSSAEQHVARLQGAGETRKCPPLPPPDFGGHTMMNGDNAPSVCATTESMATDNNCDEEIYSTPLEAINANVRSKSNTPYYTPAPAANAAFETITTVTGNGSALATMTTAVHTTPSGASNALQRRRDMAKRQRANTTNVTFTPTSSGQLGSPLTPNDTISMTPGGGRARALRARAQTLTNGVPLPEVKRFEDIVVTKEEFQSASKEFERIFLGVI